MPRLQLTDEEAQVIADFRRKNEVRLAQEKVIDWCHDYLCGQAMNTEEQVQLERMASDMVRTARDLFLLEPRKKRS